MKVQEENIETKRMHAQLTDFVVKYSPRTIGIDCQNKEEATRD